MSVRLALVLLMAWSLALWVLLLNPRVGRAAVFPGAAYLFNLAHAIVFGIEALLIGLVLRPDVGRESRVLWTLAIVLAFAYSVLLEWRQGSVVGRESSGLDVLTNAIGCVGAPWALAVGTPFHRRMLIVLGAAGVSAVAATLAG